MPWLRPGRFPFSGAVVTSETPYFTASGRPLITAAQAEEIYEIRRRTVYQWQRRGHLRVRGLSVTGQRLYDAGELAAVHGRPWHRKAATSVPVSPGGAAA